MTTVATKNTSAMNDDGDVYHRHDRRWYNNYDYKAGDSAVSERF